MKRIRITESEKAALLARDPRPGDVLNGLEGLSRLPRRSHSRVREAIAFARAFNDRVVRPSYRDIDLEAHHDPNHLPLEFIREAWKWGIYSRWIPKLFGGDGDDFLSMYAFLEEIASVCTGLANVIGVHYLGVGTLCATWNMRVMKRVLGDACRGDEPCLISLAITEPEAGTDVEEPALLRRARIGTTATRVKGGYVLNGRKIFISNGHVSTWHMVIAYGDRHNLAGTSVTAAVRTGTPGFSFGHREHKMGQKACVASELIFEDCFVPDGLVCIDPEQAARMKTPADTVFQYIIDFVVSSSRAGVAAFAAGAARGAYEAALEHAAHATVAGRPLVSHQWAHTALAEMYKNACAARTLYMESGFANALRGMFAPLYRRPLYYMMAFIPCWYFAAFARPFLSTRAATYLARRVNFDGYAMDRAQTSSGWASLAKFACSDLAVENARLAMELMGVDGTRYDRGAEKFYRDARLLQIYEGTNQLNRLNLFKNLVARDIPAADVFG